MTSKKHGTDEAIHECDGGYKYRYTLRDGEAIEVGPFTTLDAAKHALSDTHESVRAVLLDARSEAGCDTW